MAAAPYFALWTLGGLRVASEGWGCWGGAASQPLDLHLFLRRGHCSGALGFVVGPACLPHPRLLRKHWGRGRV